MAQQVFAYIAHKDGVADDTTLEMVAAGKKIYPDAPVTAVVAAALLFTTSGSGVGEDAAATFVIVRADARTTRTVSVTESPTLSDGMPGHATTPALTTPPRVALIKDAPTGSVSVVWTLVAALGPWLVVMIV